ncbi:hypothetical protein [Actinomadura verrucosospora]|uniref:Immunity protein Imm1 n=1 Tax=Actinomadura verrucosospora TaxID=46165 RepID=A0A7D3VVN8_ACTVE|nr:hypothetical protein [Actinomadura verrucosospora]QKG20111.1 hypothetical protein ACTIVE_1747 [Actinomadura verrucosospora]
MPESWKFDEDGAETLAADETVDELGARIGRGILESWLISSSGRLLAVVTNTERAMVMLLDGIGDPGEHATDPEAAGFSEGFILANGQHDEYPDEDTVPLTDALQIVRRILISGNPPADAPWQVDR